MNQINGGSAAPRRRRVYLIWITLGIAGVLWLLALPAHTVPIRDIQQSGGTEETVTCDPVLFAGPAEQLSEQWDGTERRSDSEVSATTHAVCEAFRSKRLGWSLLLAIPVTVLLVRLPPKPPGSGWAEPGSWASPVGSAPGSPYIPPSPRH